MDIRSDLAEAQATAWREIGRPGTWWTGPERVAIAAEVRHAPGCALCAARKLALSPNAVGGDHSAITDLPAAAIDRKSTRLNSSHGKLSRMPSSA